MATIENLFTFEGKPGHEICLVYECTLADERLYQLDEWDAEEVTADGTLIHPVAWKRIDSFGHGGEPLYPEELFALFLEQPQ